MENAEHKISVLPYLCADTTATKPITEIAQGT
jgi:hypothetical protein